MFDREKSTCPEMKKNCLTCSAIDAKWKENLEKVAYLMEQERLNYKVTVKPRSASA